LPSALAVFLALPGYRFTWLWDDFDFLSRVLAFRPTFLLPDPQTVFYRPLSRELGFCAMWILGNGSPIAGHIVNGAILAVAVALLVSLVVELSSPRAGVLAGIAFASLGAVPLLVAWASGVQDLLAILLGIAGLKLALRDRPVWSALILAAAALSKETALAFVPVAACLPWILGRQPARGTARQILPFLAVILAWGAIAPGVRVIAHQVMSGTEGDLVGVGAAGRASFLVSMILTLANLPVPGAAGRLLEGRLVLGVVGVFIVATAVWLCFRPAEGSAAPSLKPAAVRVTILGALLAVLPLALTTGLVRAWNPHYAAFPAVGTSLLIGSALSRTSARLAGAVLIAFLAAGIWTRGTGTGAGVACEANLERTSNALLQVEAGFKTLHPTLPHGSLALVSVASSGPLGVHTHIHRFQALRVWYRDPSIVTAPPQALKMGAPAVFLFRVIPTLDVVEIDPEQCRFRSSGAHPTPMEVSRPARTFVRAVAALGDPVHAAEMQRRIASFDRGWLQAYDLRLAAMYLLASGRQAEAQRMLTDLPAFSRENSLVMIKQVFADATPGLAVEEFAFDAFGVARTDVEANRTIMRLLKQDGNLPTAAHFAKVVIGIAGHDSESEEVLREFGSLRPSQQGTSPLDVGSF